MQSAQNLEKLIIRKIKSTWKSKICRLWNYIPGKIKPLGLALLNILVFLSTCSLLDKLIMKTEQTSGNIFTYTIISLTFFG